MAEVDEYTYRFVKKLEIIHKPTGVLMCSSLFLALSFNVGKFNNCKNGVMKMGDPMTRVSVALGF